MKATEESRTRTWNITEWMDGDVTATATTPSQTGDYIGWTTGAVYADGAVTEPIGGLLEARKMYALSSARVLYSLLPPQPLRRLRGLLFFRAGRIPGAEKQNKEMKATQKGFMTAAEAFNSLPLEAKVACLLEGRLDEPGRFSEEFTFGDFSVEVSGEYKEETKDPGSWDEPRWSEYLFRGIRVESVKAFGMDGDPVAFDREMFAQELESYLRDSSNEPGFRSIVLMY